MKTNLRMISIFVGALLLLALALGLALPNYSARAAGSWYVDPAGNDTNDCQSTSTACQTIGGAFGKAAPGDTINVATGTYVMSGELTLNKANITLAGAGSTSSIIQVSYAVPGDKYPFRITAAGVTIDGFGIQKTNKAGEQDIIYVGANNISITNNDISGQFVIGDGDVSRAMEVTYGISGLLIQGNTFHALRQPIYINGSLANPTTGNILDNYTYGTKGWVMAGANMTFTNNTWGTGANANVYDIVILSGTDASYYTDIPAIAAANNGAFIEDQRVVPATLSIVYVDGSVGASGDGTARSPKKTIAEGITRVMAGGTIHVLAGTYAERPTISKSLNLYGAQYGVDPTASGARVTPVAESTITSVGTSTPNPDVVVEIASGVNNVKVDGFTIIGDPASGNADKAVVRMWSNALTISNNIINGYFGVLYKGADTATVSHNRITVNKVGVTVQPNAASNVTISGNQIIPGTSPASDASGIYLTSCTTCSVTGNTITGFTGGNAIGGNGLPALIISGNTLTGNKKGVNVWGNSDPVTISNNTISNNIDGIGIKGANITISGNTIQNNTNGGITIDKNSIETQNVTILHNVISGNTVFGLTVTPAVVGPVDAKRNWWGAATGPTAGEIVGTVPYVPWCGEPACTSDVYPPVHNLTKDTYYTTIQAAITDANPSGDTISVAAGTYDEDLTINKSLSLIGAGASSTTIRGVIGGGSSTIQVGGSNVTIAGFTITRLGNTVAEWNLDLNTAGIAIQGLANTGAVIHDNIITGMRTGIDINDSSGHTIRNNVITDNRTGMIMRNQTDNLTVVENEITNNWTVGVLFLDASSGSNSPLQTALNCTFSNNNLSGNWYGQVVDRQTGSSLPLPGANLKNFSGNWYGTTTPFVSTANSTEPGYAALIPVEFGGTAVAPGGQPDILGTASANIDFTPYLNSGMDTNVETTSGRGTFGFQGGFSNLWVTATSAQTGTTGRIQEGINSVSGSTVNIADGLYFASNTTINKSLILQGQSQAGVVIAPAAEDGNADNAFANNAQNGLIVAAHNVTIKNLTIDGRGNPGLTAGKNNFRAGIVTLDASQSGGGAWNNLHVDNVFIKYAYRRGISVFPTTVSGTIIENSRVEYIAYNHCMYLAGQSQALNNTLKHCFQGIVQALDPTTPAGTSVVTGNTITEIGNFPGVWGDLGAPADPRYQGQPRAIQFNNSDSAGRTVEIRDNIINDVGSEGLGGTVGIYTRLANSASIVDNNTITLTSGTSWAIDGGSQSVGMLLGWSYSNGFTASNNHVNSSGYGMGVMVFGAGTLAKPMVLEGNTITATSSTRDTQGDGTGIYIANQYLFASDKNESYVIIRNGNAISGFVRGIDVEKVITSTQPLTVTANRNLITGNTIGIDASTLSAAIDATNNYWGAASGPLDNKTLPNIPNYNNPLGTGNAVSAYVDYKTWCVNTTCVNPPLPLPSSFHGYFHYIGTQPAVGTVIEAYVPGVTVPVKTTTAFDYGTDRVFQFDVQAATPGEPKNGGEAGDTVTFMVAGRIVATAPWISGTDTLLNFHPPEAVTNGPYSGMVSAPIALGGSANDWLTSDTFTYAWDLDNNGTYETSGKNISHTWPTIGVYTIGLQVTDSQGGVGIATTTVYVQTTCTTSLVAGWNLVSLCLAQVDPAATGTVLSSLNGKYDLVYGWDGSSVGSNWLKFAPGGPGYANDLDRLDEKMGFWIHMTQAATLTVTGYPPSTTDISIYSVAPGGWNLVGFPKAIGSLGTTPLPTIMSDHGLSNFSLVYAYHAYDTADLWKLFDNRPGVPGFASDLKFMEPAWGYWVQASGATQHWLVGY